MKCETWKIIMQYNGGHDYYLLKNIFIIFKKRKINEEIVEIPKNKINTTINTIFHTSLKCYHPY